MNEFMRETIVGPLARRVGTFAGAYILSLGVTQHDTSTLVAGITCGVLVAWDLFASWRSGHKGRP